MKKPKGGKKGKEKPASGGTGTVKSVKEESFQIDDWKEEVVKENLNTADFQCETAMIVESSSKLFDVIEMYRNSLREQNTYLLQSVTCEDAYNSTTKGTLSLLTGKFESAVVKLARKEIQVVLKKSQIPTNLFALWIKLYLIILRNRYVSHKNNYVNLQKALDDELNLALEEPAEDKSKKGKGKGKGKAKGKDKGKSKDKKPKKEKKAKESKSSKSSKKSGKNKKGKVVVEENIDARFQPKQSTLIRNEMRRLKQSESFILPEDNFDIFFILNDFYDPCLLEELEMVGCPVRCLLEISEHTYSSPRFSSVSDPLTNDSPVGDSEKTAKMNSFWKRWFGDESEPAVSLPSNTHHVRYVPQLEDDPENTLTEDILAILRNTCDFKRQYIHYLRHLKVLDVEEKEPPPKLSQMKVYNRILNAVPNECMSVSLVLFALVEEVCVKFKDKPAKEKNGFKPFDFENEPQKPKKTHGDARDLAMKLIESCDVPRKAATPTKVIDVPYGNVLKYTTAHSGYANDIKKATTDILRKMPPLRLLRRRKLSDNSSFVLYSYLFNKWCRQFGQIDTDQMTHCLNAYLFQNATFHAATQEDTPRQPVLVEDLIFSTSKPHNKHLKRRPLIRLSPTADGDEFLDRELVRVTDDQPESLGVVYVENYDPVTTVQVASGALAAFKYYSHKYYPPNDTMLLKFYNCCEEVSCDTHALKTPVNFRDFCTCVVRDEVEWLDREEDLHWSRLSESGVDDEPPLTFEEFILPGSIKDKIRLRKLAEEAAALAAESKKSKGKKDKKDKKGKKDKKEKKDKGSAKKDKKSSKKDKGSSKKEKESSKKAKNASKMGIKPAIKVEEKDERKELEVVQPCFEAYNLGENYFKLTESSSEFHSVDGIAIEVHQSRFPASFVQSTLKVSANENSLVMHFGDNDSETFDFHLNLCNGAVMVFGKPHFLEMEMSIPPTCEAVVSRQKSVEGFTEQNTCPTKSKSFHLELNLKENMSRRQFCQRILEAAKNCFPLFKICSSKMHRFHYVKRVARRVTVPLGSVTKKVFFKPKVVPKRIKPRVKRGPKFFPYSKRQFDALPPMEFEWKTSLPTGLHVETVRSPLSKPFYITQKYLRSRPELKAIDGEVYRCLLRSGPVLKFMRNGDLVIYHPDKTIRIVKYSAANVKMVESLSSEILGKYQIEKDPRILPLHALARKPSKLERKIKKLNRRFRKHMIGIIGSFRLPSLRKYAPKKARGILPEDLKISETVIEPNGAETFLKDRRITREVNKYYTLTYTNCANMEILTHRQDGTSGLLNNQGILVTQFPDGTRITSWPVIDDENFYPDEWSMAEDDEVVSFVLVQLNFKFQHPYYATVEYYNDIQLTKVMLPDKMSVKINRNGSYHVNLPKNDWISISRNDIVFTVSTCSTCKGQTNCIISPLPLYENFSDAYGDLLYYRASDNKIFQVDYTGKTTSSKQDANANSDLKCECGTHIQPTTKCYLALRRDYSSSEYHFRPPPTLFGHTMVSLEPWESRGMYKTETDRGDLVYGMPLKKTYMEHLMMLYDDPVLCTSDRPQHLECVSFARKRGYCDVISERPPMFIIKRTVRYLPLVNVEPELGEIISQCVDHERRFKGVIKDSFMNALMNCIKVEPLDMGEEALDMEESSSVRSDGYTVETYFGYNVWDRNSDIRRKIEEYRLLINTFYDPEHLRTLKYPYGTVFSLKFSDTIILNLPWGPYEIKFERQEDLEMLAHSPSKITTTKTGTTDSFSTDSLGDSGDISGYKIYKTTDGSTDTTQEMSTELSACCKEDMETIYVNKNYAAAASTPQFMSEPNKLDEMFDKLLRQASRIKIVRDSAADEAPEEELKDLSFLTELSEVSAQDIEIPHREIPRESVQVDVKSLGSVCDASDDSEYKSLSTYFKAEITEQSTEKVSICDGTPRNFPDDKNLEIVKELSKATVLEESVKNTDEIIQKSLSESVDRNTRSGRSEPFTPDRNQFDLDSEQKMTSEITENDTQSLYIPTRLTSEASSKKIIPFHKQTLKIQSSDLTKKSGFPPFPMLKKYERRSTTQFREKLIKVTSALSKRANSTAEVSSGKTSKKDSSKDELDMLTVCPRSQTDTGAAKKTVDNLSSELRSADGTSDEFRYTLSNVSHNEEVIMCPEELSKSTIDSDVAADILSKPTIKKYRRASVSPCECPECNCSIYQTYDHYPETHDLDEMTERHLCAISDRIINALVTHSRDSNLLNLNRPLINKIVYRELEPFKFWKSDTIPLLRMFENKALKHSLGRDHHKVTMRDLVLIILNIVREEVDRKTENFSLKSYNQCDLRYMADLINMRLYKLNSCSRFEVILDIIRMLNETMYEHTDLDFVLDIVANKYNQQLAIPNKLNTDIQTVNHIIYYIEKTIYIIMQSRMSSNEDVKHRKFRLPKKTTRTLPACDKKLNVKHSSDKMLRCKRDSYLMAMKGSASTQQNLERRKKVKMQVDVKKSVDDKNKLKIVTESSRVSFVSQGSSSEDFVFEDKPLTLPKKQLFIKLSDEDRRASKICRCCTSSLIDIVKCEKI